MTENDGRDVTIIEAVKIDRGGAALTRWRAQGIDEASYRRLDDKPVERRQQRRRGARLRSGKALDVNDRFLCDCAIRDRAEGGARLTLARNIVPPGLFLLYEDDSGEIFAARIAWRRGADIGCRLSLLPLAGKERVAQRMKNRCYAI